MKKILLATTNKAKLQELSLGMNQLETNGFKIISLNDLHIKNDPEETGMTFKDNALLKATYYAQLSGISSIADDGGLMIDILNGEPGVKSKRWLGREATDKELINYTLERLNGKSLSERKATIKTCLCFYDPVSKVSFCEEEQIRGHIAETPSGRDTYGYPFRALFIVEKFGKYYDELTVDEHEEINHRLKALKRLSKKIIEYYKTSSI